MFGYIKPTTNTLSEEEQALYKSVYCGLCHSLGKIAGQCARLTLSYDFVFLALLRMAVSNETPMRQLLHCPSHPFKGCSAVVENKTLDYCAALSVLLTYESIEDKLTDEKGLAHFSARMAKIPAKHYLNRVKRKTALPFDEVRQHLQKLAFIEKNGCESADAPAEIFGQLLADASSFGIEDEMMQFAVSKIMFRLGKWIYLIDAADDFIKDKKSGSFNPFLPDGPDPVRLQNSLEYELSYCDDILRKIPTIDPKIRHILRNILFYGTASIAEQVLFPERQSKGIKK